MITTELEAALDFDYEPTIEWVEVKPHDVVAQENEANSLCAQRILGVFYDVSREFIHINLGIDLGT